MANFAGNITTNPDRQDRIGGVGRRYSTAADYSAVPYPEKADAPEETHEQQEARAKEEVASLARTMSRRSQPGEKGVPSGDPLHPEDGGRFDPWSDNFDADAWTKAVWEMSANDPKSGPHREAGVSFDNLSAYGYGTDSDYQTTVGNLPLKAFGALKSAIGQGGRKVQILSGVDGILEPGDMLVVLGPPGRCDELVSCDSHQADIVSFAVVARPSSRRWQMRRTASISKRTPKSTTAASRPSR